MRWKIFVEDPPGTFAAAPDVPVYDDQFAPDGSEWGDAESAQISTYLESLTAADPDHRSFAATLDNE